MKDIKLLIFAALILGLVFPLTGWADENKETVIFEEIVVSAPRTDRMLVETPASITIITAEDIEEMGAANIVEIVQNIPGVVKDSDSRDRLTFRGNRSPQSAGVLVLINGIPANGGISGYTEYDGISVSDIERVEVLRSSGGIAFGPDASRGVINVITKKGEKGSPVINAGVSYGSWQTWKEYASISGRTDKLDYAFSGSLLNTDGYEDDNKQMGTARLSLGHNVSDNTRFGFNLSWQSVDYDTIYGKTEWQVNNYRRDKIFPTSATNSTLVNNRENEDENIAMNLEFNTKGTHSFVNGFISYDQTDHVYKYLPKKLDPTYNKTSAYFDYQEDSDQDRYLARVSGGYRFENNDIKFTPTLGVDFENISYDQTKAYLWSPTPLSASQLTAVGKGSLDTQRERYGAFVSNELDFNEHWELNFSGRLDQVDYEVESKLPQKVNNSHTDFSWDVTPAFHPVSNSTLYVSVSQSYWYPVLQYYKYAMEYGDADNRAEDLKPEEYQTYELGYKQYFNSKLSLALNAYYMKVDNKFLSLYDNTTWKGYRNVGASEHKGIEMEASGRICSFMGYRLLGAYQDAEWDTGTFRAYVWGATPAGDTQQNIDISGQKVPHVPEVTSTFGLDFYFLDNFKFSSDLNYYGKQYVDVLNRYEIDGYVTANAGLSYTMENFKVWVLCNNIFNREENNIFNETGKRNADGTPDNLYYPLNGRSLEMGLTITF
ncbi:MAG: TonB-dependent receptor [Proteobacteria bacterium]|nr:TonB-dependent receptor [Pseudomonadota bacterium]MBU1388980.1 TonB-dependent receptor [Pseudomonadota bacterium]MBU1543532.1 TonB-dependent receptor [Pseudomonadota bacterium]MBU2430170.1 TonB-dependent receptor [Pseudomonadota bacterium]MBU2480808.1 TonB-dependent receptor [Pseudomonadota bacterium]